MNILVTGGQGYVGSALVPMLLNDGHKVVVVDTQWFGKNLPKHENLVELEGDVREPEDDWFDKTDVVVHLAGISNDPTAELNPLANYEINSVGTIMMAQKAKDKKVRKFVFASTCSVYGFVAGKEISRETSKVEPHYPYGISKLMAETALHCLADTNFDVVILRKGTIGGYAPRMRYDLVINTMTKSGLATGKLNVKHASLWRPIVSIHDVVRAYKAAIEKDVRGTFNIAQGNYTIKQLGKLVAECLRSRGYQVEVEQEDVYDLRNYKASNEKALEEMEFSAEMSVADTVTGILDGDKTRDFHNPKYYNIKIFEKLQQEERL